MWDETCSLKIHVEFFSVVTINQRRPCLTPWRAQTAVKPSFELKAIWRDVLTGA